MLDSLTFLVIYVERPIPLWDCQRAIQLQYEVISFRRDIIPQGGQSDGIMTSWCPASYYQSHQLKCFYVTTPLCQHGQNEITVAQMGLISC